MCHAERLTKPVQPLGPHVASLGMRFWRGEVESWAVVAVCAVCPRPLCLQGSHCKHACAAGGGFPAAYNRSIFIAQHGSWARSIPIGYRQVLRCLRLPNSLALLEGTLQRRPHLVVHAG